MDAKSVTINRTDYKIISPAPRPTMKKALIIIGITLALLVGIRFGAFSNQPIFGIDSCLKFAVEAMGNPAYGKSCSRSSYINEIGMMYETEKSGAVIFKFRPSLGYEAQCPPIEIVVDRSSGEASIYEQHLKNN